MFKKLIITAIAFIAFSISFNSTVYAASLEPELYIDGIYCNNSECDVTLAIWVKDTEPHSFEWKHKLDKTKWTAWKSDDDLYHVYIPSSEIGKHKLQVKVRIDGTDTQKYTYVFSLTENGYRDIADDGYGCFDGTCNFGVIFKSDPVAQDIQWRYKIDKGDKSEWETGSDYRYIPIPDDGKKHKISVWVTDGDFVYKEVFKVNLAEQS